MTQDDDTLATTRTTRDRASTGLSERPTGASRARHTTKRRTSRHRRSRDSFIGIRKEDVSVLILALAMLAFGVVGNIVGIAYVLRGGLSV
jgi:hypothetical protein